MEVAVGLPYQHAAGQAIASRVTLYIPLGYVGLIG